MVINVTRSSMPSFEEYCEEIKGLWDSRWLTNMGEKHKQFERDLKEYLRSDNLALFTNGHLALETALASFDFPKGSEVITTPFTFASTTHAITRNGLVPAFCDVHPDDYTIDASKIEALITEKTVAILPVHVYGNICDTDKIAEIARKHGLIVIYDAAHAFGVFKNNESSANFGDVSMFSFHATKVFHTIEGGCLCFRNPEMLNKLNSLKNFGLCGEDAVYAGGNAKMNEFQASMGICNLRHLDNEIEKRKAAALRYRELLRDVSGIKLNTVQDGVRSNYAYFPVLFDKPFNRDEIFLKLKEKGVIARKYFYPLTNAFECYKGLKTAGADKTPVAKEISEKVLCLPIYADLSIKDVDFICKEIISYGK